MIIACHSMIAAFDHGCQRGQKFITKRLSLKCNTNVYKQKTEAKWLKLEGLLSKQTRSIIGEMRY